MCFWLVGYVVVIEVCFQVPTLGVGGLGGAVQLVPALGLPGVQLAQLQQAQPQTAQPLIGNPFKLCYQCFL